jgi:DNA-binding winged helix-turn-helix (wHTH) protein
MTNPAFPTLDDASRSAADASLDFGRFRVRLRQRQLLADGLPIELGTRAFELLLALLDANGSLVSKEQLLARVWPGIAVADANVKVHVCALRKALGEDRDFIRTEFGRGYRFIAAVHSTVAWSRRQRPPRWRHEATQELLPSIATRSRRIAMRLNALCLIGSLAALAIPLPAGAVPAQSAGAVSAQWGRQAAVTAPQGRSAADVCAPGYYWEPGSYAPHGKFRPAHCARRW